MMAMTPGTRGVFRDMSISMPFFGTGMSDSLMQGRGKFSPSIWIKMLPLKDMSPGYVVTEDEFEQMRNYVNVSIPNGERVKALPINGKKKNYVEGTVVQKVFDYGSRTVRVYVQTDQGDKVEVILDSIFRQNNVNGPYMESLAPVKYIGTME